MVGTAWYADEIAAAEQAEIIRGMQNRFEPDRSITREEMVIMLVRAYEHKKSLKQNRASTKIKDSTDISVWALPYVQIG
ncbi:hypothetical protein J14TS5_07020 [Paenibacillus lautus]|uniref:S-layer homology domain-containing protein n=1 Tax=Paenibacillus lautus TaxID=1401 RepID=UPI001B020789|nr:S-layer homology domain-containing protein [Paenibacillus lautus]GIO95616.1 hypothetical protein J14TS5_07020 [Paenibacillus lautus]